MTLMTSSPTFECCQRVTQASLSTRPTRLLALFSVWSLLPASSPPPMSHLVIHHLTSCVSQEVSAPAAPQWNGCARARAGGPHCGGSRLVIIVTCHAQRGPPITRYWNPRIRNNNEQLEFDVFISPYRGQLWSVGGEASEDTIRSNCTWATLHGLNGFPEFTIAHVGEECVIYTNYYLPLLIILSLAHFQTKLALDILM